MECRARAVMKYSIDSFNRACHQMSSTKLCTTSSSPVAGDRSDSSAAFSPASSSTSRRITVEQIKSAREEARRQERAWAKAIGKAVA